MRCFRVVWVGLAVSTHLLVGEVFDDDARKLISGSDPIDVEQLFVIKPPYECRDSAVGAIVIENSTSTPVKYLGKKKTDQTWSRAGNYTLVSEKLHRWEGADGFQISLILQNPKDTDFRTLEPGDHLAVIEEEIPFDASKSRFGISSLIEGGIVRIDNKTTKIIQYWGRQNGFGGGIYDLAPGQKHSWQTSNFQFSLEVKPRPEDVHALKAGDHLIMRESQDSDGIALHTVAQSFQMRAQGTINPRLKRCTTLAEAVEKAKRDSFNTRLSAIEVSKAREFVGVRRGMLFPSFNLRITLDWSSYIQDVIPFLFPANWAKRDQAVSLAEAEKFNLLTTVANQVVGAQELYFIINRENFNTAVLESHLRFFDGLIKIVKTLVEGRQIAQEGLHRLRSEYATDALTLTKIKKLQQEVYPKLAQAMALNGDWENLVIEPLPLPDLAAVKPIDPQDYFNTVLVRSYALQSFAWELDAARHGTRARRSEFLSPDSTKEAGLGIQYPHYIRIGELTVGSVTVRIAQYESQLKQWLFQAAVAHNRSLEMYQRSQEGVSETKKALLLMIGRLEAAEGIDITDVLITTDKLLSLQQEQIFAQHEYLNAKAQIGRLILEGPFYADIGSFLPATESRRAFEKGRRGRLLERLFD